jgi:hypothetical protein
MGVVGAYLIASVVFSADLRGVLRSCTADKTADNQ